MISNSWQRKLHLSKEKNAESLSAKDLIFAAVSGVQMGVVVGGKGIGPLRVNN